MPRTKKVVPEAQNGIKSKSPKNVSVTKKVLEEKNKELEEKIRLLEERNRELEDQNRKLEGMESKTASDEKVVPSTEKDEVNMNEIGDSPDVTASSSGIKKNTTGKKAKIETRSAGAKNVVKKPEKLKNPKACVSFCNPGTNSGCCQRSGKRRPEQLKCTEVVSLLTDLGVKDCSRVSKCLLSGLQAGFIKLPEGGNLDTVLFELGGNWCNHLFKITLRKLLFQPDFGGTDYEELQDVTVFCESHGEEYGDCEEGRTYVINLCSRQPTLDNGKFHNHCGGCPGFGRCLNDSRNACRVNKKTGAHYNPRYVGTGGWLASDDEDDDGIGGFGSRLFWF